MRTLTLPNTEKYSHLSYPEDGLYLVTDDLDQTDIILALTGYSVLSLFYNPTNEDVIRIEKALTIEVEKPVEVEKPAIVGISEDTLLKAIAMVQRPDALKSYDL